MAVDPTPNEVDPAVWAALPRKRVGAGVVLMLLYAGEVDRALPIVLQEEELRSWRWCDASGVEERTTPFMARRLTAALAARAEGAAVELEDGYPVA